MFEKFLPPLKPYIGTIYCITSLISNKPKMKEDTGQCNMGTLLLILLTHAHKYLAFIGMTSMIMIFFLTEKSG